MRTFISESLVETKLVERLESVGSKARVSVHSDSQPTNSIERTVIFKAAVALYGSEAIVNKMIDIGTDEDRAISYKGSQVEPTEGGEVRYLFFEAKINPYEEQSWE